MCLRFRLVPRGASPLLKLPGYLDQRIKVYRTLTTSPSHATSYRKGLRALAAPAVVCCVLLACSRTIAGTHHSEHLPLHLFDFFAVRAGDVKEKKLHFAFSLVYWQHPNLNKTPLSSPALCKANKVIASQHDSRESDGSRETGKAVAISRSFLFKLQVKVSVLSLFRDENLACLAFQDVMQLSSLKLQGI